MFLFSRKKSKRGDLVLIYAFDEPIALWKLKRSLKKIVGKDLEFYGFTDTEKLYAAFKQKKADIVIVDLNYKKLAGRGLISNIDCYFPRINYVGLTNKKTDEEALFMVDVFASDYIVKPFDTARLREMLGHLRYHTEQI